MTSRRSRILPISCGAGSGHKRRNAKQQVAERCHLCYLCYDLPYEHASRPTDANLSRPTSRAMARFCVPVCVCRRRASLADGCVNALQHVCTTRSVALYPDMSHVARARMYGRRAGRRTGSPDAIRAGRAPGARHGCTVPPGSLPAPRRLALSPTASPGAPPSLPPLIPRLTLLFCPRSRRRVDGFHCERKRHDFPTAVEK